MAQSTPGKPAEPPAEWLRGTLDLLLLELLAEGPSYGYEITQTVLARSAGYFAMKEGSLYPALHRLERRRWVRPVWREVDGRRRKYYELTAAGRKAHEAKRRAWSQFSGKMALLLGGADAPG